jgi:multidrug efflux pump subunit AcrA (membrane-fusion protein)
MKANNAKMWRWARTGLKWLVVALVVGFAVYRMKFAPMAVVTHKLAAGPVVAEVMGTGTLEARVKTTISPRIQERLAEVLVDQGDAVKSDQLLARLDDGELKMQVEVAEAARVAARASLERVKTDEARAVAVGQQARLDYKRISDLLTNRIRSQADFDKAVEQVNVAEADGRVRPGQKP